MNFIKRVSFGLAILFIGIFPGSCTGETSVDCSLVLCAGNEPVYIEILLDGENLLSGTEYLPSDITISGQVGISTPELQLLTGLIGATEAFIELRDANWTGGASYEYLLELGSDWRIPLEITFDKSRGGCCGGSLRILALNSSEFLIEKQPGGFYRLILG